MSLPPVIPPAYAAALYGNAGPNYYNTPWRQGLRCALQAVQCVDFASLVDTDTFSFWTVPDGTAIFEFDVSNDGVTPGNIDVGPFVGTETAAQVAALVQAAIVAAGLHVVANQAGSGLLVIQHTVPGEVTSMTESVAAPEFAVYNYNYGSDGDGFVPVRWGLSRAFVADGQVFS